MKENRVTDNAAGSYDFGNFDQNQNELARLKRQAAIVSELEAKVLRDAGLKSGMRVLDLACGPGIVSVLLAEAVAPAEVIGVDLSESLLDEARAYAASRSASNVRFQQGNVYSLDDSLGQFDFIYTRFLFQHLADPETALRVIRSRLAPGGKLCVADIDDTWLTLHPEPDGFRSFTEQAARGQAANGGDRQVGRKLGGMLQAAGLQEVAVQVTTVSSRQLGMRNFLDITTGFKKEQVPASHAKQAEQELRAIYQLAEDEQAWGFVAVFVATGTRGA